MVRTRRTRRSINAVLHAVRRAPGLPVMQLAIRLGLQRRQVESAVATLTREGLIERRRITDAPYAPRHKWGMHMKTAVTTVLLALALVGRLVLPAFVLALWVAPVFAQLSGTGPLTTSSVVTWDAPTNVVSPAEAQTLEYRLYVGTDTTFTTLLDLCGAPVAPDMRATCTSPFPAALLSRVNVIGTHDLKLTAYSATAQLESSQSLPFVLRTPPAAPTTVRITK